MTPNPTRGIWLMIAAVASFAAQDGFSRHLAENYNTLMIVMIRYWAFAAFVIFLALRRPEGPRAAIRSTRLGAHILRSALLVTEVCVIVWGYTLIGLINSHAVFAICPLLVVALSGPLLGERISLARWAAVSTKYCPHLQNPAPSLYGDHLFLGRAFDPNAYRLLSRDQSLIRSC